ncbi:MAG: hypothetical protein ACE15C_13510 [Phycisphaerae bacterium]
MRRRAVKMPDICRLDQTTGKSDKLRRCGVLLAVISCTVMSLWPLLSSGYYSDDLVNSTIKGRVEMKGVSIWAGVVENNRELVVDFGRLLPTYFLLTLPFAYLLPDLPPHKAAVLLLVAANLLLFYKLMRMLVKDYHVACLAVLLMPVLFQFRLYHDPILSLCGMMQFFMTLMMVSAMAFLKYLERRRWWYLAASLISYNVCLYFYEISIPLVVLFLILAAGVHGGGIRSAARKVAPYVVSAVVALALAVLVRVLHDPAARAYGGIAPHLGASTLATALLAQLTAALPLSYHLFDPSHLFRGAGFGDIGPSAILPVIVFALAYWYLTGRMGAVATRQLLLLGGALLLVPALMISMSSKYQEELEMGLGYVPVYVQYFGLAMLAICLLMLLHGKLAPRWRRVLHLAVCAALSAALLCTILDNRRVVDKANIDVHYRRAALVKALREGILAEVPDGANLLILDAYAYDPLPDVRSHLRGWAEGGYPWKNAALVYQYAAKRLSVTSDVNELAGKLAGSAGGPEADGAYLLKIESFPAWMHRKEGYVTLSRITGMSVDAAGQLQLQTSPLMTNLPG